jgi:hypothetical protein
LKIFISYRRADSKYVVDRIRDRLIAAYDEDAVFRDIESIPPGQNFSNVLKEATTTCDVMLVVMGTQWAGITDDQGNKRLFESGDYTRLEVEAGLTNPKILVIPVLVMGAKMPSVEEIPNTLVDLRFRNAISVRPDPDFASDMQRLIDGINEQFPEAGKPKKERKTMDPVTLAATATSLLAPFLKKVGEAALDKLAEQAPGAIGKIWHTISKRSEKVTTAAKELASDADPDNEELLTQQLQTALQLALKKDQGFASLLTELVEQAQSESGNAVGGDQITASANNNSTAVGKISIGGNVSGNFTIGNNNQITSK